ncbi:hypothetical protein SRRS_50340 [Sporomusa rhizae]
MIDRLFLWFAFGVLSLCFSGIIMVLVGKLFRTDRW